MSVNIQVKRSNTASKRPNPASLAFGELALNYNAVSTGLFFAADNGTLVKVGPAAVSATAPNSAPVGFAGNSIGEFWFDTTASTLKLWDGLAWVEAGGSVQGVTGTAPINVNNTDPLNPVISISAASTIASGAVQLEDSTSSTSTTTAATPNSVKDAYDLAAAALPLSGGTMTGNVTFANPGDGLIFADTSNIISITDSTSATSSVTAASATAVKAAYDLADAALPKSGGTMTGDITFNVGQTFPGTVTSVTAAPGSPITVDNTTPSTPVIDITASSTAAAGAVQLEDSVTSNSTTLALTANQGYLLQQQINSLVAAGLTLAGTFSSNTGNVISVTPAGTAAGFTAPAPLPAPSAGNNNYFVIVEVPGTNGPNSPALSNVGDWFLSDGTSWVYLNVGYDVPDATTTQAGIVRLATTGETQTGTDGTIAITPSGASATYIPYTTFTTLGQLLVGTGAGTVGTLVPGGDGQFLIADSGAPLGLSYTNTVDGGTY